MQFAPSSEATLLFSNAETAEDAAEQFIARDFAGDLAERALRIAEFLGDELARATLRKLPARLLDMHACTRAARRDAGAVPTSSPSSRRRSPRTP